MRLRVLPLTGSRDHLEKTLRAIGEAAGSASISPSVRSLAIEATRACPPRDGRCEARAIESWLRSRVKFTRDPIDTEYVQDLGALLRSGGGDCDDFTGAALSLGGALGMPGRAVLVTRPGESRPGHVYAELLDRKSGRWVSVDPTLPPGVRLPRALKRRRVMILPGRYGSRGRSLALSHLPGLGDSMPLARSWERKNGSAVRRLEDLPEDLGVPVSGCPEPEDYPGGIEPDGATHAGALAASRSCKGKTWPPAKWKAYTRYRDKRRGKGKPVLSFRDWKHLERQKAKAKRLGGLAKVATFALPVFGSIVPGLGTALGASLGGILGKIGVSEAVRRLGTRYAGERLGELGGRLASRGVSRIAARTTGRLESVFAGASSMRRYLHPSLEGFGQADPFPAVTLNADGTTNEISLRARRVAQGKPWPPPKWAAYLAEMSKKRSKGKPLMSFEDWKRLKRARARFQPVRRLLEKAGVPRKKLPKPVLERPGGPILLPPLPSIPGIPPTGFPELPTFPGLPTPPLVPGPSPAPEFGPSAGFPFGPPGGFPEFGPEEPGLEPEPARATILGIPQLLAIGLGVLVLGGLGRRRARA